MTQQQNSNTNNNINNRHVKNNQSDQQPSPAVLKVNYLVNQMSQLEHSLNSLYNSYDEKHFGDWFMEKINPIRSKYESLCLEAIFTHFETASNLNVDTNHWRCCFHRLIETLRKEHNYHKQQKEVKFEVILTNHVLIKYIFNLFLFIILSC